MTRVLPGVYVSLYDLSTLPESQANLTVGYVLRSNRGPVGTCELMTSASEFLNRYTFSGQPTIKDDPTFWSILQVFRATNQVYISRASKNALYGGLVVKKDTTLGTLIKTEVTENEGTETYSITVSGSITVAANDIIRIANSGKEGLDKRYTVLSKASAGANTKITVAEKLDAFIPATEDAKVIKIGGVSHPSVEVKSISSITAPTVSPVAPSKITIAGDYKGAIIPTSRIKITGASQVANNIECTVTAVELEGDNTVISVAETLVAATSSNAGTLNKISIVDPESYVFADDDLFLVYGIDQGAYNDQIGIQIVSSSESPDSVSEKDVFVISTYNANTDVLLDDYSFMCSLNPSRKAIDGTGLYAETVMNASSYVRVKCNSNVADELPSNTSYKTARLYGGSDGTELTSTSDYIAALDLFEDNTVPISILGNGTGTYYESEEYQTRMISIAEQRKDCVAFLNTRYVEDESALSVNEKAKRVVNYKKSLAGATSFYATMYAPHVNYPDTFNSRQVRLGTDALAISGWLNTILNQGYPYAFAGPTYGQVSGVTTNWKIGDMSGIATSLNDASINYIAYDAKVGRYYMQCQNTLQIANSSLRNLGAVFNVLDIKETFAIYFKEYLQRPITNALREEILQKGIDYMNDIQSRGRCLRYSFVDTTSDLDLSNNTLRYTLSIFLTPYAQQIYVNINCVNGTYSFEITQG